MRDRLWTYSRIVVGFAFGIAGVVGGLISDAILPSSAVWGIGRTGPSRWDEDFLATPLERTLYTDRGAGW